MIFLLIDFFAMVNAYILPDGHRDISQAYFKNDCSVRCESTYTECIFNCNNEAVCMSECNRLLTECLDSKFDTVI